MPKTKEYYVFKGKFYIASSPIQVTRFPPPKIIDDDTTSAHDYWEDQRIQQWNELDAPSRAMFTWPSRAETPKAADVAFSCQSLSTHDKTLVHDIAMDNFCLLVFKVTDVEHFDYSVFPPKRLVCLFYSVRKADGNMLMCICLTIGLQIINQDKCVGYSSSKPVTDVFYFMATVYNKPQIEHCKDCNWLCHVDTHQSAHCI